MVKKLLHFTLHKSIYGGHHGRICPSPLTIHLYVVSASSPIGPLAWSFCVDIPISAPKPNSPPSENDVGALRYTHAASTDERK